MAFRPTLATAAWKKAALSRSLRLKMLSGIGCFAYRRRHPDRHARSAPGKDAPL
jgi:hypothetical protein